MAHRDTRDQVIKLTDGLLRTLTDFTLFCIFFSLTAPSAKNRGYGKAGTIAMEAMSDFNYTQIKNAIIQLRRNKYLNPKLNPREFNFDQLSNIITREGKKRLKEIIPAYKVKRPWDGRVYLVTYDVPETHKKDRDLLRSHLKTLGAAFLQASVWVTLYDPRQILKEFTQERGIEGTIVISDIGSDGYIGAEKDLRALLNKLYRFDLLNSRYKEFIKNAKAAPPKWTFLKTASAFLAIVKDDPQLPFKVLPEGWKSQQAYLLYQKALNRES